MGFKDRGIQEISWLLKPVAHFAAMLLAVPILLYRVLVMPTLRITYRGNPLLLRQKGTIFCHWHESIPCGLLLFDYRGIALLIHPKLYMLPIYYLYKFSGCGRFVFGSSGNSGRAAQGELKAALTEGYSTVVNPDGPAGPPYRCKSGFYHFARESESPVVPFHVTSGWRFVTRDWDRKWWPLPFAKMTVTIGEPIDARQLDSEPFFAELSKSMSA